ncbi:MAG TPA: hypothetical protein VJY54_00370 [Lachnospiraceae bacterium]|nr:hypothetical protein [Lachnospiraceae bacterium]
MEYIRIWDSYKRTTYMTVTGMITQIKPLYGYSENECSQLVVVEDETGGITKFFVTHATYIADATTMYEGMQAHFVYNADLPTPLIYPPQLTAVAVVSTVIATFVKAAYFNHQLISTDNTLKLNMNEGVAVVTSNNQNYYGSPAGRYLLVMYENMTKSIPAQTTPDRIVVMCEW